MTEVGHDAALKTMTAGKDRHLFGSVGVKGRFGNERKTEASLRLRSRFAWRTPEIVAAMATKARISLSCSHGPLFNTAEVRERWTTLTMY